MLELNTEASAGAETEILTETKVQLTTMTVTCPALVIALRNVVPAIEIQCGPLL